MTVEIAGTPVGVPLPGQNPANVDITIPDETTAVYFFWGFWKSAYGYGITSAKLGGADADQIHQLTGTSGPPCVGVAVWYNPGTGVKALDIDWTTSPQEGPPSIVAFVKGGSTSAWRDVKSAQGSGSAQLSVTVESAATDLVLFYDQKYNATPGTPGGCSSLFTYAYNYNYARLSKANSPGAETTTVQAQDENYSSCVAVSIPQSTGGETRLEDFSLELRAYHQHREDFASFLRAHDGLEYRDLQSRLEAADWVIDDLASFLSAYFQEIEDAGLDLTTWGTRREDLQAWLAAFFQGVGDIKTALETWATGHDDLPAGLEAALTVFKDLPSWFAAYGQNLCSFAAALEAGAERRLDLAAFLQATDGVVTDDFTGFFIVTDGAVEMDLGLDLRAVAGIPAFRSITAQKVSAVVHEVS